MAEYGLVLLQQLSNFISHLINIIGFLCATSQIYFPGRFSSNYMIISEVKYVGYYECIQKILSIGLSILIKSVK